jgi:hypothetical protein
MRLFVCTCLVAAIAALGGCSTAPSKPPVTLTGNLLVDGPNAVENGPPRDRVLWAYRTAAAAIRHGQIDLATRMLDDALLTLGGIPAGDKSAAQSRGYFRKESSKTFRGEPYERVMAYYYRGILYWMKGEPDNARACFRSAQLQDSDTVNHEYASDYVLLDYLDGLATRRLAGDGSDAYKRALAKARLAKPPEFPTNANTLFFLELGPGPVKYATGDYGQELRFRSQPTPVQFGIIKVAGQQIRFDPMDDLDFQATTRGGRVMDHVLANKAVFKSTTGKLGDAALISGGILAMQQGHNSAADEVGAGLLVAGLAAKLFSAATTPAADTRSWDNLPRFLSFTSASLPPGEHPTTVEFYDSAGRLVPKFTKQFTLTVDQGHDKVVFISDQSATPQKL